MRAKAPRRQCLGVVADTGLACRQAPTTDRDYCFWHDPENVAAAAEARRLGQQRSKREASVAGAYEISGIDTVDDLKRVLEVVLLDTLALNNGVPRNRLLVSVVQAGLTLIKQADFEERLAALEEVIRPRRQDGDFA